MQIKAQEYNWLDEKLSENIVMEWGGDSCEYETLRIYINDELEVALGELNELKDKLSQGDSAKLLELCKENAINTITSQFGLASLVISSKDGGSVTTIHNAKKDIYSNEKDKYNRENYTNKKNSQGFKFEGQSKKSIGSEFTKSQLDKDGNLIDAYTKQKIKGSNTSPDHIVPIKDFHKSGGYMLDDTKKADFATDINNLASTNRSINSSLSDSDKMDWIKKKNGNYNDKKAKIKIKEEEFEIDMASFKQAIKRGEKTAEKHLPTNMEKIKYYGENLIETGAKDAGKMAVYSAFALILREFIEATIDEIKITLKNFGDESFSEISKRFKTRLGEIWENIKAKWKDILKDSLEGAITAFFSNLLVFAINLVTTTLKKIVSIIRAGFVSLVQAIKMIVNPPENVDKDDVYYEAFKILITGIIGGASLGLSAGIDSLLASVPGLNAIMALPLPFSEHGTVGSALSVTISALLGGILTTIAIYYMDKFRSNAKQSKLKFQLMAKSGEVVQLSIAQSWFVLGDGYKTLLDSTLHSKQTLETAKERIRQSDEKTSNKIKSNFDEINNALSELENL
ncbi:DUF1524 domain-containing protein [Campylobacter sp. CN_NA1]|uniref:DUF1524 domain-containing protein n=1 Tax=Campylobacter sp. CN_NA1 TaxID=2984150 RepID=UPI0022E9E482|nr:DUF1524 domain-containing protein [Campylobacter sp. CN_NA1]MDA3055648.1 HNH endonuclease family protein [Campylobacter sp. CN_NA1]